jgi:hypothetical protein
MPIFSNSDIDIISNDPLLHTLDDFRIKNLETIQNLKRVFSFGDNDIRIKVFHELRNINQSLLANLTFHRSIFPSKDYWSAYFHAIPNDSELKDFYKELDVLNRFAGFYGQFSIYESRLRHFQVELDKVACEGGLANFDSITNWTLKKLDLKEHLPFCELLRLTRNTIHNNGIYRPIKSQNAEIVFNGKTYNFIVNKPVDFVDWEFLIIISNGLHDLFFDIVNCSLIKEKASITDLV